MGIGAQGAVFWAESIPPESMELNLNNVICIKFVMLA
jgi:hypothetical protein